MKKLLIGTGLSLALLTGAPALAESANANGNQAAQSQQAVNYSDADLKKFVEAQSGILEIRKEYVPKIKAAEKKQKAQQLQLDANKEMVSVIEDTGLNIKTYNAIATDYNSKEDVRKKVDNMM